MDRTNADELRDILRDLRNRGGDSTSVEVKRGAGGCPSVGSTLSAFGNMPSGGLLLVGLDESDNFRPTGVEEPAVIEAGIASQARRAVSPPVHVDFEEAHVDGALIVVARIAPLPVSMRPCRYQGSAYLRQADGDYVMSDQEVQQLLAMRDRPRHDAVCVAGTSARDLDGDLVRSFIAAARANSRRLAPLTDEEVLRRKGVLGPDSEELTLAGLYALGEYPQQFAPSLSITAAVQLNGSHGDRTRDLVHLDGPLPALLEDAMAWVHRNTRTTIRFDADGQGRDVEEIPNVAVRELVANALVHRDLSPHSQGKRVELRLTDDALVVHNPGGLWGLSHQQLGSPAAKSAVNEHLYEMCKLIRTSTDARVIEGEGGGIRDVQRALRHAQQAPPRFIDKGVSFTVLVPRPSLDRNGNHERAEAPTVPDFEVEVRPVETEELPGRVGETNTTGPAHLPREERMGGAAVGRPVTPNAPDVLNALQDGPLALDGVVAATGLTRHQVRYALTRLVNSGQVTMLGGWGKRGTTYGRSGPVGSAS